MQHICAPAHPGPFFGSFPCSFQLVCAWGAPGTGTIPIPIPIPAAMGSLLLGVWPKQRAWGALDPPGSSFETQDQHNHPQLKVPAPFPPQIRFPPRFCLAGTELLIGFVLLVFQLPQIWAALPAPRRGGHGHPRDSYVPPGISAPLIHAPAPASLSRVLGSRRAPK